MMSDQDAPRCILRHDLTIVTTLDKQRTPFLRTLFWIFFLQTSNFRPFFFSDFQLLLRHIGLELFYFSVPRISPFHKTPV
jgi:hypothetical protein